ncbi:MAG: hypothetical protein KKF16_05020 [Euryarchaeota archaeon]|nr:hypothetical protein [Euryarchaeota archaeon]MBV1728847.1 hypothetical protein [Methanobacterium sp.]MBV1755596.1 hypothetical protein [Methanobacterium sp.]MBV1768327.1 hypothetical protein [Methanobacterium sp.]
MFVPPTWLEGFLIQFAVVGLIPLFIAGIIGIGIKLKKGSWEKAGFFTLGLFILMIIPMYGVNSVFWHYNYEVPSINEKIITVQEWQPKPGIRMNENGMMVINNADQLLLITTENEGFLNEENFFFGKFNTRDIFNKLKVGGTYKIKYYGWREGFNSGFSNILNIEEVIDEKNATVNKYGDYFGTKIV